MEQLEICRHNPTLEPDRLRFHLGYYGVNEETCKYVLFFGFGELLFGQLAASQRRFDRIC